MTTELFLSLFTAAGLGSMLTALLQNLLQSRSLKRERIFREKKEAYIGMLQALHAAAVQPSERASKEFAFWQLRCELVSPRDVRVAIQEIVDTNDDLAARSVAFERMKELLRSDLGLSK